MNREEINKAKDVLRKAGYHVDYLWHVEDVTELYECDSDKAYEILTEVLERTVDGVFDAIQDEAMFNKLPNKS
jgi:hypothetical protein